MSPSPSVRRFRPSLPLLALALVLAQLAQLGHLALSPHALCAEHGEMVEAVGRVEPGVPQAAPAVGVPPQADALMARAPAALAEHVHCDVFAHRQVQSTAASPVEGPLGCVGPEPVLAPAAPQSLDARETFRLAPKQSPPTTA